MFPIGQAFWCASHGQCLVKYNGNSSMAPLMHCMARALVTHLRDYMHACLKGLDGPWPHEDCTSKRLYLSHLISIVKYALLS